MPKLQNENEAYARLLCRHMRQMVSRLRKMTPEHWDWTPDVAAPTARILAAHAYQGLIGDRYHINEPDAFKHPYVPELPFEPQAACDAFAEEIDHWEQMILALTSEELDAPRKQFNRREMSVREFICHMIQHCIYKHGQMATLYFALGYDGKEPYTAPFPNPIYAEMRAGWPNG